MRFNFSRSSFGGEAHSNRSSEPQPSGAPAVLEPASPPASASPATKRGVKPSRKKALRPIIAGKILAGLFAVAGVGFGLLTPDMWFGVFLVATGALLFGLLSVLAGVQEYTISGP